MRRWAEERVALGVGGRKRLSLVAVVALVASAVVVWPASAATPVLTTQASPGGFPVGLSIFDVATLALGQSPGGTITFNLYGPDNATCAGPPTFTSTKPVNGNNSYTSDSFTTIEAGTYQWLASYSGDPNNDPAANLCNELSEQVTVTRRQALLSTQASPSVAVGGQITDTATVASGAGPTGPGGTITFSLYGPANITCAPPATFTSTKAVSGNGNYTSDPFTPTLAGTYQWIAQYTGDANNLPASNDCADMNERVIVTAGGGLINLTITTLASPSVTLGGQVTDTATLALGNNPTGSLVFTLYGPNDATCSSAPVFTSTPVTVTGNVAHVSPAFTPTLIGTYRWRVAYSGDAFHNPVSTLCNAPGESVVVSPVPPTSTTTAPPASTTPAPPTSTTTAPPASTTTAPPASTTTAPPASTTTTVPGGATTTTAVGGATTTTAVGGATTTTAVGGATTTTAVGGATTTTAVGGATTTTTAAVGGATTTTTTTTTTTLPVAPPAGTTTTVAPGGPQIQVNPPQGQAALQVILSGSGFAANDPLTATFNSAPVVVATPTANAVGGFSIPVRIPSDATLGQHTFVVVGASGRSASTPFTVIAPASGTAAPTSPLARTGTSIRDLLSVAALLLGLGAAALFRSSSPPTT